MKRGAMTSTSPVVSASRTAAEAVFATPLRWLIALAPLVTIWGAIAIVVGVLLAGVVLLVTGAAREGRVLGAMFAPGDET